MEDQQLTKSVSESDYYDSLELDELADLVIILEEQKEAIADEITEIQDRMLKRIPWKEQYVYSVPDPQGGELNMAVIFSHRRKETLSYSEKGILRKLEEVGAKERFAVEKLDKKQFNAWFKGETDQTLRDQVRGSITVTHSDHMHRDRLKELLKARGG